MSRTIKKKAPKPHSKEGKPARKETNEKARREEKAAIDDVTSNAVDPDEVNFPPQPKTGGWLSW